MLVGEGKDFASMDIALLKLGGLIGIIESINVCSSSLSIDSAGMLSLRSASSHVRNTRG